MTFINWISIAVLIIIVLYTGYLVYEYYKSTTSDTTSPTSLQNSSSTSSSTSTTNSSTAAATLTAFIPYGDKYLIGTKSGGTVLETVANSATALDCSNRIPLESGCVGANWYSATNTCELVGTLTPLTDNAMSTLIIASKLNHQVSSWLTGTEEQTNDGNIYCSSVLANSSFARALCANIPACGAYTLSFDANNNPYGCIKVAATLYPNASVPTLSPNIITYTGTRSDAVVHNLYGDLTNLVYRWASAPLGSVSSRSTTTSLELCGVDLNVDPNNTDNMTYVASWEATTGTCTLYSDMTGISKDSTTANVTTIMSNLLPNYLRYSNSWTPVSGVDFPNNNSGLKINFQTALTMCINSSYDCFVNVGGLYYMRNTSSPQTSNSNATAYIIPISFA